MPSARPISCGPCWPRPAPSPGRRRAWWATPRAGVVARALAAQPDLVAGLITIGSPHAGSDLLPLADQMTADAVRVAAAVAGAVADSALGGTVGWLAGLLDGSGGGWGGPVRPGWFAGAELGLVDAVPRFAIGSRLGGDLPGLLAGSTVVDFLAERRWPCSTWASVSGWALPRRRPGTTTASSSPPTRGWT